MFERNTLSWASSTTIIIIIIVLLAGRREVAANPLLATNMHTGAACETPVELPLLLFWPLL